MAPGIVTLATGLFAAGVLGHAFLALRWFGDPYAAVARDTMGALAHPSLAMLRIAAGYGLYGSVLFAAGWFARLPWLWWIYGGFGLAGAAFMAVLALAVQHPHIRARLQDRPGWEEARSRVLTADDIRSIPKLRDRAENRRGHAPFAAALLGVWIWAWWPVLPWLGG